jgi:hypothetical protein
VKNSASPAATFHGFTIADLKALLERRDGPCVSVYFPAHRRKTEARSDSILYRNLCREVEKILVRDASAEVTRKITSSLRSLDEPEFWKRGSEGVAVFAAPDFFACYRLPMAVPALEVVGVSFHTKPLLEYLQEGLSYHVLVLSLRRVALYDGWGTGLQEVPLHTVPGSLEEALGTEVVRGYRGSHPRGEDRLHHVQGAGGADSKVEVEKFFREVARGLRRNGLKESRKPLIVAAQGHYQPLFRKVAQIPTLLDEGIVADAAKLTPEEICSQARRILKPELERRITAARDEYGLSASRGQGSERLQDIARAVAQGRAKRLFVESGRRIWGTLDSENGDILPGEPRKNAYDVDLLDELAELTLVRGGEVLVLAAEQMPTATGVAATYRY